MTTEPTFTREGSFDVINYRFWSMDEFADASQAAFDRTPFWGSAGFSGCDSMEDAQKMARQGWDEKLDEAIEIAESAVTKCEQEHVVMTFDPTYDVAGSDVEIGRYLSGEPECMIDYPLVPDTKVGRVITLCASVSYNAYVSNEQIENRGQLLAALALTLGRLGYATEIWVDLSSKNHHGARKMIRIRTLVKGANDTIDPSRIMYALANGSVYRWHGFALRHDLPEAGGWRSALSPSDSRAHAALNDLPEGSIFLPELSPDMPIEDPREGVMNHLREIGLVD